MNKKLKICLVHEEYPDETNFGGIATYQKILAEEYVRLGHHVEVICRGLYQDKKYIENGVHINRIFIKQTNKDYDDCVAYRRKVSKLLLNLQKDNKIDIIETPDWGAETIFFEKYRKTPLIVRFHTPLKIWLKYNNNNFGNITKTMLNWEETMIESANTLTSCSNILKEMVIKEFDIEKSINVVYNPANLNSFYNDKSIKKEEQMIFVGSLEERKGVLLLAKALNVVFKTVPNMKMLFIGKDTTRNRRNKSTQEAIKKIVLKRYQKNLIFIGQISNYKINEYLNKSRIGIYPSLFDNYPYTVLESMSTGLHIIGSNNSGMVEMLNDETSICNIKDYKDLADKIINKLNISYKNEININNMNRAKTISNPTIICEEMINLYNETIENYKKDLLIKEEIQTVLKKININENIKKIKRNTNGLANIVYEVETNRKKYIVKKYLYKYDFDLSRKLYTKYEEKNINCIRPINEKEIIHNSNIYNVFEFIKNSNKRIKKRYIKKILLIDRKINYNENLLKNCDKYFNYINKKKIYKKIDKKDIKYIMDMYIHLRHNKLFKEKYLNHGDISKHNIIYNKGKSYLIDFDEVKVTTMLYDFAVIIIKNYFTNSVIDIKTFKHLKNQIQKKHSRYSDEDFIIVLKMYLTKIILEKFYLYLKNKIDLFSKEQLNDDYIIYLKLLRKIDKEKTK